MKTATQGNRGGGFQFLRYLPGRTKNASNHRHVMAELDALRQEVVGNIRQFEAAGMEAMLKDDYVTLHVLEHRIVEMRIAHARAVNAQYASLPTQEHPDA